MKIIDIGINGEGIGREDGKVYFVKNALPGEDVEVKILEDKTKFCKAKATKISQQSDDRVIPPCPYFGECGGCDIQHMCYGAQLKFKQKLVTDTLKKIANIEVQAEEAEPSQNEYFYRNKSVFPVFEKQGKTRLGMFKSGTNEVIEIAECRLAQVGINGILKLSASFLRDRKSEGLKYLVVREVSGEFLITLVVFGSAPSYLEDYILMLKNNLDKFSVNLNFSKNNKEILSHDFKDVFGANAIKNNEMGIVQNINSASFMQVNGSVKQKLYTAVLDEIEGRESVVDAYCGAGLLTTLLAKKAKFVYGVEIVKPAIVSANKLKEENNISNIKFVCGDSAKALPNILKNVNGDFSVVLDPPRKGCDERVLKAVVEAKPNKIIYISCNPISLAQNLKVLLAGGYEIKRLKPFDMFPQTANVETLCVLEKIF